MTFPLRNRPIAVFVTAVLCSFVLIPQLTAQSPVRWIGDRPLAPFRSGASGVAPVDSVRLLAVLVEFQEDNDPQTQGVGKFDTTLYTGRAIDPPPHDRSFFETKMLFVENYFRKVSNAKLSVTGDVLPSIVTVSKVMSDYSKDTDPAFRGLARLSLEVWSIVDTTFPGVDISAYDGYVMFHAGAGKDIDLVGLFSFDPFPFDIPSIYLGLEGFRTALDSVGFNGISVRNGSHVITNTMILPETETRITGSGTSADTLMISINGLFAASVGSHLGLPDLFETGSGISAIGQHGLMDGASIFAYYGLFPPEPSAWEKIYLGWVDPIVVDRSLSTLTAPAVGLTATVDTIYKVPITADEYYLVENRIRDPLDDGQRLTVVRNGVSSIVTIPKDSIFFFTFDNVNGINGSVTDVQDYDWALIGFMTDELAYTGGGILIWHIDERIINENLATNTLNADPNRRGVDLEEADGAQDIGQIYGQFSGGSGSEFGSPLDAWFDGNIAVIYKNAFDATSYPSSYSNNGARSLISIRDFSPRSARMTFVVEYGASDITPLAGFPKQVAGVPSAAIPFDADNDGSYEFFTSRTLYSGPDGRTGTPTGQGSLLGWTSTGTTFLSPADSSGLIAEIGEAGIGSPILFRSGGVGYAAAASVDKAYVWSLTDANTDGRIDSVLVHPVPVSASPWTIAAIDSYLVVYGAAGISAFSVSGQQIFSDNVSQLVAATGIPGVIARGRGSSLRTLDLSGALSASQLDLDGEIVAMASGYASAGVPVLSVMTTPSPSSIRIHLLGSNGTTLTENTSFDPARFLQDGETYLKNLALADANGDGNGDIVLSTTFGRIVALNMNGILLDKYPTTRVSSTAGSPRFVRSVGGTTAEFYSMDTLGVLHGSLDGTIVSTQLGDPAAAPSYGLGRVSSGALNALAVFAVQSTGFVGAWQVLRGLSVPDLLWPVSTGDPSGSFLSPIQTANPTPLSSGILPADRTYNWPNPVYDDVTYIRYFSDKDGTVSVEIFDLAGDRITQLNGTAVAGQDGEIPWNVTGIQSGVYLARIEINAGGQTAARIIKVAVIK